MYNATICLTDWVAFLCYASLTYNFKIEENISNAVMYCGHLSL